MGRDDYYVIVCKILVYLYKRIKGKDKRDPADYIIHTSKDFPITEDYLNYILEQMVNQEFVENVQITRSWDGDVVMIDHSRIRITPKGIDYLRENSMMKRIVASLPEAAAIIELFM